jgi:hypothetical protein
MNHRRGAGKSTAAKRQRVPPILDKPIRWGRAIAAKSTKARRFIVNNEVALAIVMAIVVICLGVFWGWYNNRIVPVNYIKISHYWGEPHNPLSFMSGWDGPLYLQIAQHGYKNAVWSNFFPLYPAIIGIVNKVIPSVLDSGLIVAWTALVGAIYFYIKIVKRLFHVSDNLEALRALLFFVFFPTGVFLIATFTESLFAFLALGAIYFALKKQLIPTALFAAFCTATHVNGIAVLLLLALILWEEGIKRINIVLTILIGSTGLLFFMLALFIRFHNPFLFITAQTLHGWLKGSYSNVFSADLFNLLFILGLLLAAIYWWPRRKSFSVYALTFIAIPIVGRQFGGFNRYVLMAFPLQLMLYGYLRDKKTAYALAMVFFGAAWAYFTLQYAGGYVGG